MNTSSMGNDALTCQEFVELVTEYLESTLTPVRRTQFEAHLHNCDGCEIYLEQMQQTIQLLGKLNETSIPAQGRDRLLQAFREWKRE